MCGIAGIVASSDRTGTYDLALAGNALRHRGPDDQGCWWSPDGRVGFAHTRLAIVDLSPNAHQPMIRDGEASVIAFNGEIYNFRELRASLKTAGFHFSTESDTEVLIHAFRRWGADFLTHLNGMFALAIYDERERRVILARDRAGEKPLFYRISEGTLYFASALKSLLQDARF